jgi:hypothetical protein
VSSSSIVRDTIEQFENNSGEYFAMIKNLKNNEISDMIRRMIGFNGEANSSASTKKELVVKLHHLNIEFLRNLSKPINSTNDAIYIEQMLYKNYSFVSECDNIIFQKSGIVLRKKEFRQLCDGHAIKSIIMDAIMIMFQERDNHMLKAYKEVNGNSQYYKEIYGSVISDLSLIYSYLSYQYI